jgi:hypothetical protein
MALTAEERKRRSDRMKAYHAAKKKAVDFQGEEIKQEETILSNEDINALIARVKELEESFKNAELKVEHSLAPRETIRETIREKETPEVDRRGALVGSFERYILDPAEYPDPSERLAHEPKLARFAFPINYRLDYKVEVTSYQTLDGVNTREPRFTLDLVKLITDDETGEPTGEGFSLRKLIMHEDPEAALSIADQEGIKIGDDESAFLNEMRYLRMRDWLLEVFYPKPSSTNKKKKEMVVGNRVVEVFEINSQDPQAVPFGELNGKI